ncbi:MAG: glycoside hydrolase domain-containing protein [Candidatus Brocadiia bacterium]
MPLRREPAGRPAGETRLRRDHTLLLYAPRKGAELALKMRLVQVGRYTTEVLAELAGAVGERVLLRPQGEGGPTSGTLRFRAPARGVVAVRLSTHANAAVAEALGPNAWLTIEASRRNPLHAISRVGRLYFFVPSTTRRFAVFARGGGRRENVRIQVFAPDGRQAAVAAAPGDQTLCAKVEVPARQGGKVWSLTAGRPPDLDGVFEDAMLWLSEDVPPYVSPQPDGLLVPFCHGLTQPPIWRGRGAVRLSFALNVEPPEGARLAVSLTEPDGSPLARGVARAPESVSLAIEPDAPLGTHRLAVALEGADGQRVAEGHSAVTVTPNLVFVGPPQPLVRAELLEGEPLRPGFSVRTEFVGRHVPLSGEVRLLRTGVAETPGHLGGEVVVRRNIATLGDEAKRVAAPAELGDGHYQWRVVARTPDGAAADAQFAHFLLKDGRRFAEVPPPASGPLPASASEEHRPFPGFVAFVPEGADAIAYNCRPVPADLERPLHVELARGEYEPATLGILAAADLPAVRLTVEPPRHGGTGDALAVDVRIARHWPQRVSWRTTTYRIVPEMLEPNQPFSLAVGQVRQVWLTLHAPAEATPGPYAGRITVEAGGRRRSRTLEARVLPFRLRRPEGVHWGLYSDSSRWRAYPDSQVRAELADVAAHGITTLMMYPPYHTTASYEGGKLSLDASEFVKYMAMAREAGLGEPWVLSFQALESTVRRLLPAKSWADLEFRKVYRDYARHFATLAEDEGWGECVWHAIDEPWTEEKLERAVRQLGAFKEAGLTTFTTAGVVPPQLDRVLDVRCYSRGYLLGSPGVLAQRTEETRRSGDRLWYYGSGCYTGQDGNAIGNRFVTGFLFWRSGAEGEWSWTFLRPRGDALDDFDGRGREHKDACTVYPSTSQAAPTPTLQWEGIREGIDDYRYACTLERLAKQKGGEAGRAALSALRRLTDAVPIRPAPGDFSAADAQRLRAQIAREILKLLE